METPEYLKQQEKWQTRKQFNREKLGQRKMEELIYIRESLKDWHYPILAKKKKKKSVLLLEQKIYIQRHWQKYSNQIAINDD